MEKSETLSAPQYGPQPKFTQPVDTTVVGLEAETVYLGWRADKGNSLQCDTLNIINKGIYKSLSSELVVVKTSIIATLVVVDNRR